MRRLCAMVLVCLLLTQTAFAASGYKDVSKESAYDSAIAYVLSNKYMCGYPDGTFRPDGLVTLKQLSVVLGRVFKIDVNMDSIRWMVNKTYINPGLLPDDVIYGPVKPAAVMAMLGRAFNILPNQGESVVYPAYSDSDAALYMQNAGMDLGVFDWLVQSVLQHEYLSRADLAYLIYRLNSYQTAHPEISDYGWGYIKISCVGNYEYLRIDAWDDILILPWAITKHFHDAGYQIVCGEAGVSRFNLYDMSVVGVFSPVDKTIFVQEIDGVIHTIGHYVSSFMVGLTEATAAFPRERAAAMEYISPNAGHDVNEFFAECFNYYIRAKNANNYASMDMMRERMPEIWAFISNMDVLNWCAAPKYVAADVVGTGIFPVDFVITSVYCR